MTNEQLAQRIKDGDTSAITPLWEGLRLLLYRYANRYIALMRERCAACGVTVDDLIQESYFAMLDAVDAWTPDSGYKVTAYLKFPLKNRFNAMCNIRGARRDALNQCSSLDAPLSDDTDDFTLIDTIQDTAAGDAFDDTDNRIYTQQLRTDLDAALDTIPPDRAAAVRSMFFDNLPLKQIAEASDVSFQMIRTRSANGLRDLRRGAAYTRLKAYREAIISNAYHSSLSTFRHTFTSSTELAAIRLAELEGL